MIPDELLIQAAVNILSYWLLSQGFVPSGDWDADDPACLRDCGPHRIICVQAHVPAGQEIDKEELFRRLDEYLNHLSALPGSIPFHAYEIEEYQSDFLGPFIFASIYHTA